MVNPHSPEGAIELLSSDDSLKLRLGSNAKVKARLYDESIVFPMVVQYYDLVSVDKKKTIKDKLKVGTSYMLFPHSV